MTLDELVSKCKCGVHLTVNGYKDYYGTISERFSALDQLNGIDWATESEKEKIIKLDSLVELQYYKNTPVGSVTIISFSVKDALNQANEDFK